MKVNIRLVYLYLFSLVGLLVTVIGSIQLVDLGLKTLVFREADRFEIYGPVPIDINGKPEQISEEEQRVRADRELVRSRQRQLSTAMSMVVVGAPLYWYHWTTIKKEGKKE